MLRDAIKQHELFRDAAAQEFPRSLKRFPGESKEAPESVMERLMTAEHAIAHLQAAQMQYNLRVTVQVPGVSCSLALAIKLLGGVARSEKMWRDAAGTKVDRYAYTSDDVRDPNQIRAEGTIAAGEALTWTRKMAKRSAAFRQAIAVANATEVEIEGLDESFIL